MNIQFQIKYNLTNNLYFVGIIVRYCGWPSHTQKHSTPHQFLITSFDVRLLVWLIVSGPAVGNEVADDGRIVGDLRTGPSDD